MGQMVLRAGSGLARRVLPGLAQSAVTRAFAASRDAQGPRRESLDVQTSVSGAPMARIWGRYRLAGEVIWASRYREHEHSQGGKGGGRKTYGYTVSLAVGLCEGVIAGLGRVWANGEPVDLTTLDMRVHDGMPDQHPDPLIEAIEGADAPAFRDTAYVVFEDLDLEPFGGRIPSFAFEVLRPGSGDALERAIQGVNLIPGSGEFSLSTERVSRVLGPGHERAENRHSWTGQTDILASLDQLQRDLPHCRSVQVVLSWFGTDLRCGLCEIRPGVETRDKQTRPVTWSVAGQGRSQAHLVSRIEDRPAYGGTPDDAGVIALIRELRARRLRVTLYPFILMDIAADNGLPDPHGAAEQPAFPWRGRIVPDPASQTGIASQVAQFFGDARASDFSIQADQVSYSGPQDWRFNRFILHCAALAKAAGGVDGFLIGSEMVALTTAREGLAFPAVGHLIDLSVQVRAILGTGCRLSYAADWSEYAGITAGQGERLFHLDPLWAAPQIDAVAIDWYPPLTDWREGETHLDAALAAFLHDPDYLRSGMTGGEGYDWYYVDADARAAQQRTPITDLAHGEDWIWRIKDLANWWGNWHHDRPGGTRSTQPTAWVPQSKPIWITELGFPAVDKGSNQPNLFYDPKSSESAFPHFSTGARDDVLQRQALLAALRHWEEGAAEAPLSPIYGGPMVEPDWVHVWAYDARPFPDFPARGEVWSDGENWQRGHWLNGRVGAVPARDIITDICHEAGLDAVRTDGVLELVTGFALRGVASAREGLAPLLSVLGIDVWPRVDALYFVSAGMQGEALAVDELVVHKTAAEPVRTPAGSELAYRDASMAFVDDGHDYQPGWVWRSGAGEGRHRLALQGRMVMDEALALHLAEDRLVEANQRLDGLRLTLPPVAQGAQIGDVLIIQGERWQIGALDHQSTVQADLARPVGQSRAAHRVSIAGGGQELPEISAPVLAVLDRGEDTLWVAAAARGDAPVTIETRPASGSWAVRLQLERPSVIGVLNAPLDAGAPGRWDRANRVQLDLVRGAVSSQSETAVLNGQNRLAVAQPDGDWEVLQFAQAKLVAPDRYELSGLLRGQAGSAVAQRVEAGAMCVLLEGGLAELPLDAADIGRRLDLRARQAGAETIDATTVSLTPRRGGLRPYSPVHLRFDRGRLSWIRRTRVDGDRWDLHPLPLGERAELYQIRVSRTGHEDWTRQIDQTSITLSDLDILEPSVDVDEICMIQVVQLSERAGASLPAQLVLTL